MRGDELILTEAVVSSVSWYSFIIKNLYLKKTKGLI